MKIGFLVKLVALMVGFSFGGASLAGANEKEISRKLEEIVIPEWEFQNAEFTEVLEFLRLRAIELDPKQKGFNVFVLGGDRKAGKAEVDEMKGANTPIKTIMDQVAAETEYTYAVKFGGVVFHPKDYVEKKTPKADKIAPARMAEMGGKRLSEVSFGNTTLDEVAMFMTLKALELFPEGKAYQFTVAPEFKEMKSPTVDSYHARDIGLDDMLDYLCQELALDYELKGREVIMSSTKGK